MNSDQSEVSEKKPTKGEIFKKKHGISKTRKRLLKRNGLLEPGAYLSTEVVKGANTLYRGIARKRRASMKVIKRAKKDKTRAGKKAKIANAIKK